MPIGLPANGAYAGDHHPERVTGKVADDPSPTGGTESPARLVAGCWSRSRRCRSRPAARPASCPARGGGGLDPTDAEREGTARTSRRARNVWVQQPVERRRRRRRLRPAGGDGGELVAVGVGDAGSRGRRRRRGVEEDAGARGGDALLHSPLRRRCRRRRRRPLERRVVDGDFCPFASIRLARCSLTNGTGCRDAGEDLIHLSQGVFVRRKGFVPLEVNTAAAEVERGGVAGRPDVGGQLVTNRPCFFETTTPACLSIPRW